MFPATVLPNTLNGDTMKQLKTLKTLSSLTLAVALAGSLSLANDKEKGKTKPAPVEKVSKHTKEEKTMEGGLKYTDLKVGTGKKAESGKSVVVHYTGWLTDKTEFDSSKKHGQPFEFTL